MKIPPPHIPLRSPYAQRTLDGAGRWHPPSRPFHYSLPPTRYDSSRPCFLTAPSTPTQNCIPTRPFLYSLPPTRYDSHNRFIRCAFPAHDHTIFPLPLHTTAPLLPPAQLLLLYSEPASLSLYPGSSTLRRRMLSHLPPAAFLLHTCIPVHPACVHTPSGHSPQADPPFCP